VARDAPCPDFDVAQAARAGHDIFATIVALEDVCHDDLEAAAAVSLSAEHEYCRLLEACAARPPSDASRSRARRHMARLEAMLASSLARAAERCSATADSLAILEERSVEPAETAWGLSARSAANVALRLRRAAADWSAA